MRNKYRVRSFTQFLTNDEYRLSRHLLLLFTIVLLALQNTYNAFEGIGSLYANIINVLFFAGIIYTNIYILIPRYLLKGKYPLYILSILFIVATGMLIFSLGQTYVYERYGLIADDISNPYSFLNIITAAILITFIIVGSTTIVLFRRWVLHGEQIVELEITTMQSELNQLKNQINPHFLFNMLNNANELVRLNPEEASVVLSKLNDLLRYQLNDSTQDKVNLSADIHFLNDYLNLEKIRRDNFSFTISKEGNINQTKVPPLIFITFVENAVKHNTYGENDYPYVSLDFKVYDNELHFVGQNSKPKRIEPRPVGGLGLVNIRRRLDLLFEKNYNLEIQDNGWNYIVELILKL